MGFVMGLIIGILAGYDVKGVLQLAVKTAAVMLLMPRVIKPIMDGLTPIAKQARSRLQAKFGGQEFLIGLELRITAGAYGGGIGKPDFYPTHHFNCCCRVIRCCRLAILPLSASLWRWRSRCIVEICSAP
ncbi:PTS transporter subunit IIC [Escherichia coli]